MDKDPAVGDPHFFSNLGNPAKLLLNKATDRHGFIAEVDFQEVVDLAHFGSTMNKDMIFPQPFNQFFRDIGFVHDLPDYLFEKIFKRDNPHDTAKLVDHDGHMPFFLLKLLHEIVRCLACGNEQRGIGNVFEFRLILTLGEFGQCPRLVENAGNVIERPVIYRDSRVLRVIEEFLVLFQS